MIHRINLLWFILKRSLFQYLIHITHSSFNWLNILRRFLILLHTIIWLPHIVLITIDHSSSLIRTHWTLLQLFISVFEIIYIFLFRHQLLILFILYFLLLLFQTHTPMLIRLMRLTQLRNLDICSLWTLLFVSLH